MLNNLTDGLDNASAGTLRGSVYVGDTCHDSTQKGFTGVSIGKYILNLASIHLHHQQGR